jgi:RNA polymerase sigma-70 factor (ECF subfamily)
MELPLRATPVSADYALIVDCLEGNADAFAELMGRHRNGVYNFIRHTIGVEADAQDIAQEVFVNAYIALPRFRADAPFEPWIYRIAANACRSYFRKQQRAPVSLDTEYLSRAIPATEISDPVQRLEKEDSRRRLLAALRELAPEQRMVIILKHLNGERYETISTMLGIPVSTVEHRLRAGRLAVRKRLGDDFIEQKGGR